LHYLNEQNILIFLVQILVLLGTAKLLGGLFRRWGWPELAGEILTGLLLGPTILGHAFECGQAPLFPANVTQQTMLETVSWFGVLFLLLTTGFEVNISTAWKQGKASLIIGSVGVLVPLGIGCAVFMWLPSSYWGENATRLTFTLFLATAASISAIAVIAKVLHDLEILKSDLGLVTLSSFVVNDVLGWLIFTVALGLVSQTAQMDVSGTMKVIFEILLFGTVCLTIGSKVVGVIVKRLKESSLPQPATILTFITCLAMLCGAITQWIGIHAILGFFLAGIMAGNTPEVSERTREIVSQMVHAVFVPIFFATIGIKIDFIANMDLFLVVVFLAVAAGGKFIGAWISAVMAKFSKDDSLSIGIAFIPGGAMEIVLGMLALELKLISEPVFVAVVFAALSSSIAVGPLLAWSLKRRKAVETNKFLARKAIKLDIEGKSRWEVIPELGRLIAATSSGLDPNIIADAAVHREKIMGTGLEKGIAVPHARLKNLETPIVAFGRSRAGIDWDARDGLPAHFVFLILTPENEQGAQVQILASIARCMLDPEIQEKVMASESIEDVFEILNRAFVKAC